MNRFIDEFMAPLPIPIYGSVDIRESESKMAPVDFNLYPAGWNNLCQKDLEKTSEELEKNIQKKAPGAQNILVIPESHTRNLFYCDHLATLSLALADAGFSPYLGSFDRNLVQQGESLSLMGASKAPIRIFPITLVEGGAVVDGVFMDMGILNHDQSSPIDVDWQAMKIPIHPSPLLGWNHRQKQVYFDHYAQVVGLFCREFSLDPDLILAKHRSVEGLDFMGRQGLDVLAAQVDDFLKELPPQSKVFIKASRGTYGMGIMVASSGEEVRSMNKKLRHKMSTGKNKIPFNSVVIQEGVETSLTYDGHPAEIVIYLVGGKSVGGFMRAHGQKDGLSNLNGPGMAFHKFCISEIRENQDHKTKEACYSIIARLSAWAAGLEVDCA